MAPAVQLEINPSDRISILVPGRDGNCGTCTSICQYFLPVYSNQRVILIYGCKSDRNPIFDLNSHSRSAKLHLACLVVAYVEGSHSATVGGISDILNRDVAVICTVPHPNPCNGISIPIFGSSTDSRRSLSIGDHLLQVGADERLFCIYYRNLVLINYFIPVVIVISNVESGKIFTENHTVWSACLLTQIKGPNQFCRSQIEIFREIKLMKRAVFRIHKKHTVSRIGELNSPDLLIIRNSGWKRHRFITSFSAIYIPRLRKSKVMDHSSTPIINKEVLAI